MKSSSLIGSAMMILMASCQFVGNEGKNGHAAVELSPEQQYIKDFFSSYESHLTTQLNTCGCPGMAIAVVKDTSIVYLNGFGVKSTLTREPVGIHTVFRLGSLSKGFSAVLATKLVEEGCLNWQDKVQRYLPEFALASAAETQKVEIRNLLSHTLGLPSQAYTNLIEAGQTIDQIMPAFKKVKMLHKVGEMHAYQNATFSIIERIVEECKPNQSFEELLYEEIFRPLHLEDVTTSYDKMMSTQDKAQPHEFKDSSYNFQPVPISQKFYNSVSSGGVNASISDMAEWLQFLLGNRPEVMDSATLSTLFQPQIATTYERKTFNHWNGVENSYYGLGWRILDYRTGQIFYHGGYVNGFRSEIAIDQRNKIGICALFNSTCGYSDVVIPSFFDYYFAYF